MERQIRTLLKALKVANSKNLNLKKEINTFLIAYRSTPHQTTGATPAELMFERKIRTKLPQLNSAVQSEIDDKARERDQISKFKGKLYWDDKRNAKSTEIEVGDEVLLKQKKTAKLTTSFKNEPYNVIQKSGSELTAQSPEGVKFRRNLVLAKKYVRSDRYDTNPNSDNLDTQNVDFDVYDNANVEERKGEVSVRSSERRERKMAEKFKDYVMWKKMFQKKTCSLNMKTKCYQYFRT